MEKFFDPADLKTTSFYIRQKGIEHGFILDIVESKTIYEAWIYNAEYGIKEFVFGVKKADTTLDDFMEIVKANLIDYIADYIKEHIESGD